MRSRSKAQRRRGLYYQADIDRLELSETLLHAEVEANNSGKPSSHWVIGHAWSKFTVPGPDVGKRSIGVDPIVNFSRLVSAEVPVITAEQIVERLKASWADSPATTPR